MVFVLDNYDSFTYNLVQYLGELGAQVEVRRNNEVTVGEIEAIRAEAEFHWLTVAFPRRLAPYMVHKGSIAVDGISLTIAALDDDRFDIQIVPFTMEHTNLGRVEVRDRVNLECDMVGKYVVRQAELAGWHVGVRPGEVTH